MNKNQLRQTLNDLSLPQASFAKLLGVTTRAVTLWLAGERAVPSPVISYLRLFKLLPPNLKQVELAIINKEVQKMREGMYGITFHSGGDVGMGVLVFEDGKVYGADRRAVKYDGTYTYNSNADVVSVELKITFPPNVESVFGVTNPYEWAFDVAATFNPNSDFGKVAVKTSLGADIDAQFMYLRTLPAAA